MFKKKTLCVVNFYLDSGGSYKQLYCYMILRREGWEYVNYNQLCEILKIGN